MGLLKKKPEEIMERKAKRKRTQSAQSLIVLIFVLVVILAVVVAIALSIEPGGNAGDGTAPDNTGGESTQTQTEGTETPAPIADLVITYPETTAFLSLENTLEFTGTADPREKLTIGGQEVSIASDGTFCHSVQLQSGENQIAVSYNGQTTTYDITCRYAVQSYYPDEKDVTYGSGATIYVELMARAGSSIQVTLDGKTIEMTEDTNQIGSGVAEGFVRYTGTYKLSSTNTSELQLGQIRYNVTCDGITEVYTSGSITCEKSNTVLASNPAVTPDYGEYIDVGSGYIVEVVSYQAETFDGTTSDDNSSPLRNYLPQGTVDYASTTKISNGSSSYMLLRCGRRVYVEKRNYPDIGTVKVVDCYYGTLPDHNEIGFVSMTQDERYTILTLDVLWKAPFYFDLLPQSYYNASIRDFRISEVTAQYVDITFCYATSFDGTVTIPENNPLFSRAEVIQNESDCTLRLYLKQTGGFYGWDSYYNDDDQLCFKFLNPTSAAATDANAYGADLTGIRILIDVGHGGADGGSVATNASGKEVDEAELNLKLAKALQAELESMGATVILNREGDTALNTDERIQNLKEVWPDICIAIHQNAIAGYPDISGLQVCYSTPWSQPLADLMYDETVATGIYSRSSTSWHYYFVSRQTNCPMVLMENGYMSNAAELAGMEDESVLAQKAQAMAKAVATYFLNIG